MPGSRSRRVAVMVIALLVAATCVNLGLWQLRRLDERRALNAEILHRRSTSPLSIEDVAGKAAVEPYRPAAARGRYDVDHEVLVFGRSLDGEAGHHVVTPLLLPGGGAILVVRGWVPFAMQAAPVRAAAPSANEVRVKGFLAPDEGDGMVAPDADGIVRVLDVRGIASSLPYDVFPLPLQLAKQAPPQPGSLPIPVPLPELSEGPHLSYAIQWFSFALVALIGGAILVLRDRRAATGDP
jgi:cytochrome oxidase assembly protein ShyY1